MDKAEAAATDRFEHAQLNHATASGTDAIKDKLTTAK
jgi:hypothetical protein